jgi:hypothetical protein
MSKGTLEDVLCQLDTATNVAESIFQHSTTLETEVLLHNELQYSSLPQFSDCEDLNAKISEEGLHLGAVR